MALDIASIDEFDVRGRRVLLRVDINSPLDPETKRISNENRINKSLPTIADLADGGARLVIIAHQGDVLDYHNLVSTEEHAAILTEKLGRPVGFIDDVAGPAARARIGELEDGDILLLDNIRIYGEELSSFEQAVKLTPAEMTRTYLVRHLAPLFDLYVNDAFAAGHRDAPSMVAFQELLPSAAGRLLFREVEMLQSVAVDPARPCVFALGGLKISDAFSMMSQVLSDGTADVVITSGVTGEIMLLASGSSLGAGSEGFINDRGLDSFIPIAQDYLARFPGQILMPIDVAVDDDGRREVAVADLPVPELIVDIGSATIASYEEVIAGAATIFVNGPPGVYEQVASSEGTRRLWTAVANAGGTTVIGGGDTVASAATFVDLDDIDYVSTGGGALVRYLSGTELPLLRAMQRR
ncbi:MAG: phosphoglycerate kinase [Acidimicrobiia bacterium]|nr:phosphoglycerate kinase [Acidimicrobiia bacterium]